MKTPIENIMDHVEWEKIEPDGHQEDNSLPYATHKGILDFGEGLKIRCYILNNGKRILDAEDMGWCTHHQGHHA